MSNEESENIDYNKVARHLFTKESKDVADKNGLSINTLLNKFANQIQKDGLEIFSYETDNGIQEEKPKETVSRYINFLVIDNLVNRYCNEFKKKYNKDVYRNGDAEFIGNVKEKRDNGNVDEYIDEMVSNETLAIRLESGKILTQDIPNERVTMFSKVCRKVVRDFSSTYDFSESDYSKDTTLVNKSNKVNNVGDQKKDASSKTNLVETNTKNGSINKIKKVVDKNIDTTALKAESFVKSIRKQIEHEKENDKGNDIVR